MLGEVDYTINDLFLQLGLPNGDDEIEQFIRANQLPESVSLKEAPFLNAQQKDFICEEWVLDAVWAQVIEELNVRLHEDAMANKD